jgi:PAS domain S-box-containing protein
MKQIGQNLSILLIEDNLGDFLLIENYLLDVFPSATILHKEFLEDALDYLKQHEVDIILLDLTLPDSKGDSSILKISQVTNVIPIIVLTGISDKQTAINSLRLGVQDYLVKDEIETTNLYKSIRYAIERKKIQQQLEQREKRFRALIENSTDGLAVLSENGYITEMSSQALNILGLSKWEGNEAYPGHLFCAEDLKNLQLVFGAVLRQRDKPRSIQFRVVRPANGGLIWLEATLQNLLHEPAVGAVVVNFRDITQRKKNEEERQLLIGELTKSNQDLKQYAYIASHNLRAPLTNLLSIINLIDWKATRDEHTQMLLEAFRESTHQLNTTLNDLIEGIKVKSNGAVVLEQVCFNEILERVKRKLNTLIKNSGAVIETYFDSFDQVEFDKVYMESIFSNLVSNALKYSMPGRVPFIKIFTNSENGLRQLCFEDNGMGMDLNLVKDRVFGLHQRFHQHADSKGIGLYLVKSQVEFMGGNIAVNSTPNMGTTFTLTFKSEN